MRSMMFACLFTMAPMAAWAADDVSGRIHAAVAEPLASNAPGCAVGVYEGSQKLQVFAGTRDMRSGAPIDENTIFYAASLTKQFTMLSIAKLVEAGKLKTDDDIRRWLPELPDYGTTITIDMLARHVAGIRDNLALLTLAGYQNNLSAPSREDALKILFRQKTTNFTPGTAYDYSNGGYLLLSEIVARASGQSFANFARDSIFAPLGMRRSQMLDGTASNDDNVARGYTKAAGRFVDSDDHPLYAGSGGMLTTLSDLEKYNADLDHGNVVWTAQTRAFMLSRPQSGDTVPLFRRESGHVYGRGLIFGPHWLYHSGGASGFRHMFARSPEGRLTIVSLCNRGDVNPVDRTDAIIKALAAALPPLSEPVAASDVVGRYISDELSGIYQLGVDNGALSLTVGSRPPVVLHRLSDGSYGDGNMKLSFAGLAGAFTISYGRTTAIFRLVQE